MHVIFYILVVLLPACSILEDEHGEDYSEEYYYDDKVAEFRLSTTTQSIDNLEQQSKEIDQINYMEQFTEEDPETQLKITTHELRTDKVSENEMKYSKENKLKEKLFEEEHFRYRVDKSLPKYLEFLAKLDADEKSSSAKTKKEKLYLSKYFGSLFPDRKEKQGNVKSTNLRKSNTNIYRTNIYHLSDINAFKKNTTSKTEDKIKHKINEDYLDMARESSEKIDPRLLKYMIYDEEDGLKVCKIKRCRSYYFDEYFKVSETKIISQTNLEMHLGIRGIADAHVLLSDEMVGYGRPKEKEIVKPFYEIAFGGYDWTAFELAMHYSWQPLQDVLIYDNIRTLSPDYYIGFYIRINNGLIEVGREGENPMIKHRNPNPIKINYFGFSAYYDVGRIDFLYDCPDPRGKPRIHTKLKALVVRAGEPISLDIKVTGFPVPEVKWTQTWQDKTKEVTENVLIIPLHTKLDIQKSIRAMTGTYRIVATNEYGRDETQVEITVYSVPDKPGGPLDVSDVTNSTCKLAWKKSEEDGGKPVRYKVETLNKAEKSWVTVGETDNTEMEVKGLQELTEYEFRVKAVNEIGPSDPLETEKTYFTEGKPRIDRTKKTLVVRMGETISFEVNLKGVPQPQVQWFKKSKNGETKVTENVINADDNTKLNIKESVRAMTGTYRIEATNVYGKDEMDVEITVLSVPSTPVGPLNVYDVTNSSCKLAWNKPEDDGGKPVRYKVDILIKAENRWVTVGITENTEMEVKGLQEYTEYEFQVTAVNEIGPSDPLKTESSHSTQGTPSIDRTNLKALAVKAGEPIFFDVKVKGEPPPKVKWFKKWKNRENEVTNNVINVDHNTKLDIKESVRAMTGTYRIVATNRYGKDEAAVEITVFSVPGTPGGPLNVSDITKSSCKLAWTKPEDDGGKPVRYKVEILNKAENSWGTVGETDDTEMEVKGLQELTEYEFRVTAVNEIGPSDQLKTKSSRSTPGKPRIDRTNLKALAVKAGEPIFFDVKVKGEPLPIVKWFKKWKNRENEVTNNVINVDYNTKLDIKESVRAMTGTYRIEATNRYGKDEAAVEITVFSVPGTPGGPLHVSDITNGSCKLAWNKPEDDGGKPIRYKVDILNKAENSWVTVEVTENTEMVVKGLQEYTEYEFRVTAVNEIGPSDPLKTESSHFTQGKPRIDRTNLKVLVVKAGEPIFLDVKVKGEPPAKVKWFKKWKNRENEVANYVFNVDHNTKLDIKESVRAMTGTYRIVATNRYGEDDAAVEITVFSVPGTPGGPLNVSDITNSSCKLAWTRPEDDGGKPVRYKVEKRNKAENSWVTVGVTENTEMEVKDLQEYTEYEFRVTAVNEIGPSDPLETESSRSTQGKPRIDRTNLKALAVKAGEPIFLDVKVKGEPPPKVKWFKKWKNRENEVTNNVINVDHNTKLDIKESVRAMTGTYRIVAKNRYGRDEAAVEITVYSVPGTPGGPMNVSDITNSSCKLAWTKPADDGGKPVRYKVEKLNKAENSWVTVGETDNTEMEVKGLQEYTEYEFRVTAVNEIGPSDPLKTESSRSTQGKPRIDRTNLKALAVKAGEPIFFDVKVKGEPPPKVKWFKKWKNRENEVTNNVINVDHNTKLDIKESVRAMTGTYRIVAMNRYGKDEAAVEITVYSVPGTPGGPLNVSDITNGSCKLAWNKSEDDGGKPVRYKVEKLNKAENSWVTVGETDNTEMEVKGLQELTEYEFRVTAVNEIGPSDPLKTESSRSTPGKPRIDRTNLKALAVKAGEPIFFDVKVKGEPPPKVKWFKKWKNRENEVTNNVINVDHNTKLDIKESVRAMTGTYRIVATNRYGKDEAAVEITVFSVPGTPGVPLNVSDITNGSCKLAWNKPEDDGGKPVRYKVEKLNKAENSWVTVGVTDNTEMEVKGLQELTEYEFRVTAVNEIGQSDPLKTESSRSTPGKPRIDRTNLKALAVKAGEPIFFDVKVKGEPPPKVKWFKKWKNRENEVTNNVINVDHNTKLDIKESVRAMTGTYRIVATNRYGKDEAAVEITVFSVPGTPGGPLNVSDITNSSCKLAWTKPEDDGGKPVRYKVEKLNKAENSWVTVGVTENTEMEVKGLQEYTEYEFRVTAVNEIGPSDPLKTESSHFTQGKPRIDRTNLKALAVKAGEPIFFDVKVKGEPPPKVKWFKKWKNGENEVTENVINVDHNTKLDIKESVRAMTGTYRIVATNVYGEDEANVNITVFSVPGTPGGPLTVSDITNSSCKLAWTKPDNDGGKPVRYKVEKLNKAENSWVTVGETDNTEMEVKGLQELTEYEFRVKAVNEIDESKLELKTQNSIYTKGKPRIDRTNLKALEVRAGEPIFFDVKVKGEPRPNVKWFKKWKNGVKKVTENVINVDNNTKLDIKESVRAMTGTYRIVATNRYGKDEAAVEITVFSVPSTPGGPLTISHITNCSCKLAWNKPDDDGGKKILHYKVEKLNKIENRWETVGETDGTEMEVKGLQEFTEYEFRVTAVNEIGPSDPLKNRLFTKGKPRIDRTNLKALAVKAGEPIIFDVKVKGEPASKVQWFKKSKNGESKVTENVVNVPKKTKLDIKKSVRAMTGTYRIVATNEYGKDDAYVNITVLSKPDTPGGPLKVFDITKTGCKLAWKKPKDDGGLPVRYVVEIRRDTGSWVPIRPINSTEMQVKGLQEGEDYYFRVKAVNDIGSSTYLKITHSYFSLGKPRIDRTNLKALTVRAGEPILFDVKVKGEPAPDVKWFKKWKNENTEVTENVVNVPRNTKLDIKESVRAMTGTYRIVATNKYGKDEAYVNITVLSKPEKPSGSLDVSECTKTSCKVSWKKPKDDGGKPVQYVVEVRIKGTDRWIQVKRTTRNEVEIKGLPEGEGYDFRVTADNEMEKSEPLETKDSHFTRGKPRIDRTNLKALTVHEGEPIFFDVKVKGEPAPEVKWFKKWKNRENEVTENVVNGITRNTKLDIKKSVRAMSGTYRIFAINRYGKDEAYVKITVIAEPDKPGGPLEIFDIRKTSLNLAWKEPDNDGGKPVTGYIVEKRLKRGNATGGWEEVGWTYDTKMMIKGLEEREAYEFRVKAINEEGKSEALEAAHSIITRDPNVPGDVISKCYVCGVFEPGIPYNAYCGDAFASDFLSSFWADNPDVPYNKDDCKKDCKWMEVRDKSFYYNESEPDAVWGEFTGGCAVRWIDLSNVYTQRTCRNKMRPMMGKHYVSKRMAKLELALQDETDGCVFSPMASLVPFSRGVSLFSRFHACVCKGHYCNGSPGLENSILLIFMLIFIISMRMSGFLDAVL